MRQLIAVLVVVSFGCGPLPDTSGTGGGSAGGAAGSGGGGPGGGGGGTAGGAGGGSTTEPPTVALTFGSCPALTPCGGDPTGTWFYTEGCVNDPFGQATAVCAAITAKNLSGTVKGRVTFSSGTQVERHVTLSASGVLDVPASCLMGVLSCAQVQTALRGQLPGATCAVAGGGCECSVSRSQVIDDSTGYAVTGTRLTVVTGTYPFCVGPASRLQYFKSGGPSLEDGVLTLTRQ